MPFDLSSAKPLEPPATPIGKGFDLGTAKPAQGVQSIELPNGDVVNNVPTGIDKKTFDATMASHGADINKRGPLHRLWDFQKGLLEGAADIVSNPGESLEKGGQALHGYLGKKIDETVEGLPIIGATVGGALGSGLGSIPLAAVGAAGGEAWRENINRMRGRESPSAGEAAEEIAWEGVKGGASQAVGVGVSKGLEKVATHAMKVALRPAKAAVENGDAARAIDTMLKNRVLVTEGGAQKLQDMIDVLDDEVKTAIQNSPATVDKHVVADYLLDTLSTFRNQVNSVRDERAIIAAWNEFLKKFSGDDIPVQLAQKIKQGTYRMLSDKFYDKVSDQMPLASKAAQAQLAHGLKEEIANAVPAVAGPNAKMTELINALNIMKERVAKMGTKPDIGAFGWLHHNPLNWAMYQMEKSSPTMSALAQVADMLSGHPNIVAALPRAIDAAQVSSTARRREAKSANGKAKD